MVKLSELGDSSKESARPLRQALKEKRRKQLRMLCLAWVIFLILARPLLSQQPMAYLQRDDVVIFQGDSITDGGRQRTGSDFNHIMGQDYAYILAADLGLKYPERNINFINRGIGSEQVVDLAIRWQMDVLDLKPNFLSIIIGINDSLMSGARIESVERYEATYDALLAKTIATLPHTKIILGEPFLLPVGHHKESYRTEIVEVRRRQAAVKRLGAKYHLPVILLQEAFDNASRQAPPEHWSWDGVHPTYAGHALIADRWLKTADAFWVSH